MRLAVLALLLVAALPAETFLIRFTTAGDWAGRLETSAARIEPWQFEENDALDGAEWKLQTARETYWHAPWERSLFGTKNIERITDKGLLVTVENADRLRLETAQGQLDIRLADIPPLAPRRFGLGGAIEVRRVPATERFTADEAAEDHADAVFATDGEAWVVWQTYTPGAGDRLWIRHGDRAPEPLTDAGKDLFRPRLAAGPGGSLTVVWAERRGENYDLWARRYAPDSGWSAPERLTDDPGPDIFAAVAADPAGRVAAAWQAGRDGRFGIHARIFENGAWGPETRLSDSPANDWEPTVAASPEGRFSVAWDTYENGDYDLRLKTHAAGRWSETVALTDAPAFEARPQAVYGPDGRLWLAWEEGDAQWGKDYVNGVFEAGMGLLMRRQTRVGVWDGERLLQPAANPVEALPERFRQIFLAPRLAFDGKGVPWLVFRYRTNTPRRRGDTYRSMWRTGATALVDGRWTPFTPIPGGYGRIDAPVAVAATPGGPLRLWQVSDGRTFPTGYPGTPDLYRADLPAAPASRAPELTAYRPPTEDYPAVHPNEDADVARVREYRAEVDGKTLRIVRGDMHRHTDVSWDGNRDGSLFDAYRYALDAARMDYLGVADHGAGDYIQHHWRRIQRAADLFHLAGAFAPLYGYERSRSYPSGHRNVMHAERGVEPFAFSDAELNDNQNTGVEPLYEHLIQTAGIVTSHTSATGAGTDWRDSNEQVETLVEIYQGYRNNYEHDGAPRAPAGSGARPEGFVWKAWEKGIKMGVQASSDHVSTHSSYALVWVEDVTREGVLDGIRERRAYAATDNILIDFRVNGRLMGAAFELGDERPRVEARIAGTGPIRKVEVIRNNRYVHTVAGEGRTTLDLTFVDNAPEDSESWYYVRVEQEDGELAWASPVWVTR